MTQSKNCSSTDQEQIKPSSNPKPSFLQSMLIGSISGATEVAVDHPLWMIKTRMQQNESLTFNPRILYRGIIPNAASMIPITATQVGLNSLFQSMFHNDPNDISNIQRICNAFFAGVGSSFVSCPTERIMTYQSKTGTGFLKTGTQLMSQGGLGGCYAGLMATMLREGMFSAFFLAVTPILKAEIKPHCSNDYAASLIAGMSAGIGATIASQSVDTIKTIQQSAETKKPIGFIEATKKIYSSHGCKGFFKGSIPRGARVMSAVTIMGWVNEQLEAEFTRNKDESKDNSRPATKC